MNILVLSDTFPPESAGGADVVAWRLARQHARMGHSVTVVTTTAERDREGLREEDGLSGAPALLALSGALSQFSHAR